MKENTALFCLSSSPFLPFFLFLSLPLFIFPISLSLCFYCSKTNMVKSIAFSTIKCTVRGHYVHSHCTRLSTSRTLHSSELSLHPLSTNPAPPPEPQVIPPPLPALSYPFVSGVFRVTLCSRFTDVTFQISVPFYDGIILRCV